MLSRASLRVTAYRSALLFSAEAYAGGSGSTIYFSLLRPGENDRVDDFLLSGLRLSNQSQHALWTDASLSDAPIFVAADFIWGPNESHYQDHRYMISTHALRMVDDGVYKSSAYYLEDQYMTVRKYDLAGDKVDILAAEKPEILARLKRVKAEAERQARTPR